MSKTAVAKKHASHDNKAQSCCCDGGHAKDLGAEPIERKKSTSASDLKQEHAPQSGSGSGCCGASKAGT
jgi:hypothetical protein